MFESNKQLNFSVVNGKYPEQLLEFEKKFNPEHYSKDIFLKESNLHFSNFIIATINDTLIASSIIWIIDEEAEIHHVLVHPDYRRQKVATKMLEFIFGFARKNGVKRVFLEVKENNFSALNLYIKHGFLKKRIREKYYKTGESAIEMSKDLI